MEGGSITQAPHTASTTSYPINGASTGIKRKRSPPSTQKFYSVRVGKEPGIYHSWAECLDQVRGFPKAAYKSFGSLSDAQAFLSDASTGTNGTHAGSGGKFYGVRAGRKPGVYLTWPEVQEQITGWKAARHKAFSTRAEAERFVSEKEEPSQQGITMVMGGELDGAELPKPKKAKPGRKPQIVEVPATDEGDEYEPGTAPLGEDVEDNFEAGITLDQSTGGARYKTAAELAKTKYQAIGPAPGAPVRIYTDGSTLANGRTESIGGVGVYFGPKDRRNISEPLTGSKQTNQRAELTAILRAIEVAPRDRKIIIVSDSSYAIKCVNEWFVKWRSNNWMNAAHKPVENKDLISKVVDMLDERMRLNRHRKVEENRRDGIEERKKGPWEVGAAGVRFEWVKGHAKDEGNEAADELAVNGARTARELGEDVVLD